jgi:hypothetical protein
VSLKNDITPGLEHEYFPEDGRSHKGRLPINSKPLSDLMKSSRRFDWEDWWPWPRSNRMFFAHATYAQLVEMKLIQQGMPSYATVRHPVDRFLSIWSFLFHGLRSMGKAHAEAFERAPPHVRELLNLDPNGFFDMFLTLQPDEHMRRTPLIFVELFRKGQLYWGCQDTNFWAVENLDRELNRLFQSKGVEPVPMPRLKQNRKKLDRGELTAGRQKVLLDYFKRDFVLWESLQS